MTTEVLLYRPRNFKPTMEASGVFCEYKGRVLFLKRHSDKIEGLTWGIPAGKLERDEKPIEAAVRELNEEVGIQVPIEVVQPIAPLYVRRPDLDFIFHMYYLPLAALPELNIAPQEHIDACWVDLQEALKLPLISGGREAIEYFYLWKNDQKIN